MFAWWLACSGTLLIAADQRPNILLICVDDLRPELHCYGQHYIKSPNIDQLAARGRLFHRHYVQAPTCGASRYTLLVGQYGPPGNNALFQRAEMLSAASNQIAPSMPEWFRRHGYTTVSIGKVSHHPGGRGGSDWNDDAKPEMPGAWDRHQLPAGPWRHPRGAMHGLAHGEIRTDADKMDVFQSVDGPDSIYPDGLITERSLTQLDQLAADPQRPFLLAVGIIRPHLPLGAPARYLQPYRDTPLPPIPHPDKPRGKSTWHPSGEFMKYNRWGRDPNEDDDFAGQVRRHYAACVSYADAQVGKLLRRLDRHQLTRHTIVVLWGDHGWHLGEHAVWGKHTLFEESLRSPLIISVPDMPRAGEPTRAIVETVDLFPTLCELTKLPAAPQCHGVSIMPILKDPAAVGHDAVSYYRSASTIRTDTHRLIAHANGHFELYDHQTPDAETRNVADQHPTLVDQLSQRLAQKLDRTDRLSATRKQQPR